MLRCCAGICGGGGPAPAPPARSGGGVAKPALRLDEPDVLDTSAELLISRFGMQVAPPGADPPLALVTPNYRMGVQRVLVLVPSAGAPFGAWDTDLPEGRGASVPILQWAEANRYEVALFSSDALAAAPAECWDKVVGGSPSRHVVVLVAARGALELLHAAMAPVHELMFSRIRLISMPWEGAVPGSSLASSLPSKPKPLRAHLRQAQRQWPSEWAALEARVLRQRLFEMLHEREVAWQAEEAAKYGSIGNLKENDVPGLKRINVDTRVARIDRDRNADELSRLIDKHATAGGAIDDDEDEPGVD